jgi:hypothetical protein
MYKSLIRPILFKFDPEEVHHFTFSMLRILDLPNYFSQNLLKTNVWKEKFSD